jgi:hypothetical protein
MKIKTIILSLILTTFLFAGQHISLFNGHDLSGWHTQADCEWSAVDGAIRGVNPNGNWCHLVTDDSYTDYYISLKYKIIKGNTGLYVRADRENSGCCGIEGMQVDFGPGQDGSVMAVVDGEWFWYEQITRAVDEGLVDYAEWNELGVEVQGTSLSTQVNGHPIYSIDNAEDMFPTGTLALQLHSGGAGDTILFKDLELFLPALIPGCRDSSYLEYNTDANLHVEDSCRTVNTVGVKPFSQTSPGLIRPVMTVNGFYLDYPDGKEPAVRMMDIAGNEILLKKTHAGTYSYEHKIKSGVYFIKIGEKIYQSSFLK